VGLRDEKMNEFSNENVPKSSPITHQKSVTLAE
jgi:hypothetical protein